MHAHRHLVGFVPAALDQRQVQVAAWQVLVGMCHELAMRRHQLAAGHLADHGFGAAAVLDQIGNGADLQAVLGGKFLQVGQARHGAVIVHDLADHGGRAGAGHAGQVAAGFGMAGAHQHATIHRLQREDMARLHQIAGLGIGCHGGLHGAGTVSGGDAGGDAFGGLDGDGEGSGVDGAVVGRHRRQAQVLAALARQRQADQAAAIACHEVDGFGRDMVGGQDQVAFVFAVFVIDQDHHLARAHVGHDIGHGGDGSEHGIGRRTGSIGHGYLQVGARVGRCWEGYFPIIAHWAASASHLALAPCWRWGLVSLGRLVGAGPPAVP